MSQSLEQRLDSAPWSLATQSLNAEGWARLPALLSPAECTELVSQYARPELFRSKVVMARHGYGRGEYQYFCYPLPPLVDALRSGLYPRLVPLANQWHETMQLPARFPEDHATFVERCHAGGQARPTPLLLRYDAGDYNCLHQDLYGQHVFPLQVAILLSVPGTDFDGGELVLTEQRPRQQSRPMVVQPQQGDAVVFAVRHRPVPSKRGFARVQLRHGVSRLLRGRRYTLGIIFHDAA